MSSAATMLVSVFGPIAYLCLCSAAFSHAIAKRTSPNWLWLIGWTTRAENLDLRDKMLRRMATGVLLWIVFVVSMSLANGGQVSLSGFALVIWVAIPVLTGLSVRHLLSKTSVSAARIQRYQSANVHLFSRQIRLWRLVGFDALTVLPIVVLWVFIASS